MAFVVGFLERLQHRPSSDCEGGKNDGVDCNHSDDVLHDGGDTEDDGAEVLEEDEGAHGLEHLEADAEGEQARSDVDRMVAGDVGSVEVAVFLGVVVEGDCQPDQHEQMVEKAERVPEGLDVPSALVVQV